FVFFFQAEDGIRDGHVTGVQTCALPISAPPGAGSCGLGRGDDQPSRPAPDRREKVDDPHRHVSAVAEPEAAVGLCRRQLLEGDALAKSLGGHAADRFDVVEPEALPLRAGRAGDERAGDQPEAVDQRGGDEYVLPAWREGSGGIAKKAAAPVEDLEDSLNCRAVRRAHSGSIIACEDRWIRYASRDSHCALPNLYGERTDLSWVCLGPIHWL